MILFKTTLTCSTTERFQLIGKYSSLPIKISYLFSFTLLLILITGMMQPSFASQQNVDSLISVLQTTKADTSKVKILYKLSDSFTDTKPDKAIEYANQGLALSKRIDFKKGQSICLNALGLAYYQIGKFDTALIYFETRYEIVSKIKDSLGIAGTYDNIAVIYSHHGKINDAIEIRTKANKIYASLNEKNSLANGYTWIGNFYKEEGKYTVALENYLKALKIYEEENDEQNIGYPLLNMSSVCRYLKKFDDATKYALEAKEKFEEGKNEEGIGWSLYRLSLIYNEKGESENMINTLSDAKNVFNKTQNTYALTIVNQALGIYYYNLLKNDIAISFFKDAISNALKMGDKNLISTLYQNLGSSYQDEGNYLKALEYLYKSDSILHEINDTHSLLGISENFLRLFSMTNQPDSVLKYFLRYKALSDSLFNQQNSESIAEMQTKYETEKKDKEIIVLNFEAQKKKDSILKLYNANEITNLKLQNSTIENEKNTQSLKLTKAEQEKQQAKIEIYKLNEEKQTQAIKDEIENKRLITLSFILGLVALPAISFLSFLNFRNRKKKEHAILNQKAAELSRLVSENDMKALRSQMNPHFIFNCVDSIERLLDDSKIEESKISLTNFSNLTRTVLENSKKREIPLSEEIETLRLYMELENMRFRNPFTFNIVIEPGIDPATTLIPPLIMQPFVENSIKHGFRDPAKSGHLKIEVRNENEFLVCMVEDNGVGRSESLNIKPISGFKKESMGMKLTEERLQMISEIKKMKSHFLIDDLVDACNKPAGTRVKMFLPYELSV